MDPKLLCKVTSSVRFMGTNISARSEKRTFKFHFQISKVKWNKFSSDSHIGRSENWENYSVKTVLLQSYTKKKEGMV